MSRSLSINLYLRPCSIAVYEKIYLYRFCLFRPFSGLQIWSINYALHFGSVKIHKIIYIGVYLVLTYIEKVFSIVFYFLSYFYWSVYSTNFFWHAEKLRQVLYLRVASIVIYGKFNCNFPVLF